jgi:hypothetical protein
MKPNIHRWRTKFMFKNHAFLRCFCDICGWRKVFSAVHKQHASSSNKVIWITIVDTGRHGVMERRWPSRDSLLFACSIAAQTDRKLAPSPYPVQLPASQTVNLTHKRNILVSAFRVCHSYMDRSVRISHCREKRPNIDHVSEQNMRLAADIT